MCKRTASILIAALIVFTGTYFPLALEAQIPGFDNDSPQLILEQPVNVLVSPEFPKPGDSVMVRLTSSYVDLATAQITWSVGGAVVKSAVGDTRLDVTAGALGSQTSIQATIAPRQGSVQTKRVTITPSEIDVIWEGETFTPPFYRGKPQYAQLSEIRVVAIPHIMVGGREAAPENLVYTWTVNGRVLPEIGGYGKSTVIIPAMTRPLPAEIKVKAETANGSFAAEKEVSVPLAKPKVVFYEDHPLYGTILNKALVGETTMEREEITIVAHPYFFSHGEPANLDHMWSMNGNKLEAEALRKIVLRNSENATGESSVGFSIRHITKILQSAQSTLAVKFRKIDEEETL